VDETELVLIDRFLRSLGVERRLSAHTKAAYGNDLAAFAAWCGREGIRTFASVDAGQVRRFAAVTHRDGLAPRSVQRRLSALRSFYRFLLREQVLRNNPGVDVRAPKAGKRLPKTLDVDLMSRLLATAPGAAGAPTWLDVRDHAVLELFYSSGLRLAELVGLDLEDLDLKDRTVRVLGKGRKTRIVPVGKQAADALVRWLAQRSPPAAADTKALFVGRNGRRLGGRAVQLRVDAWARRQGVGQRVHPHLFRHSFATHLLESSGDLRGVQELLGHANVSTTQIYTHLDFQHLARVYDAAHPRARRRRS
jgi:integrase/recombinase XerC